MATLTITLDSGASFTANLPEEIVSHLEVLPTTPGYQRRIAKGEIITLASTAVEEIFYSAKRRSALGKHTGKVKTVKAEGAASGVTFQRRTPLFADREFADKSQAPAVIDWAAKAPSHG